MSEDVQSAVVQILLLGTALLVVGFIILWPTLRARRVGKAPHCAACDYIVGGIKTPRCPECGADLLAAGALVYGQRPRRRRRAIIGLSLMTLGLLLIAAMLTPAVRRIEWYRHRPTAWVIGDLKSANPTVAGSAWLELKRRLDGGKLSDGHRQEMIDVIVSRLRSNTSEFTAAAGSYVLGKAEDLTPLQRDRLSLGAQAALRSQVSHEVNVAVLFFDQMINRGTISAEQHDWLIEIALEHQATGNSLAGQWLLDRLADWELAGKLKAGQSERFYHQIHDVGSLDLRRRVILGDPVPYRIVMTSRGPESLRQPAKPFWWLQYKLERLLLDDKAIPVEDHHLILPTAGKWTQDGAFRVGRAGKHKLEAVVTLAVHHGVMAVGEGLDGVPARARRQVNVAAEFQVFEQPPPDYIRWIDDASAARAIKESITVGDVDASPRGTYVRLSLDYPPVNVAFEVVGRVAGKEYPLGTFAAPAGAFQFATAGPANFPPSPGGRMDVVLRSSEKAVRETIDLYSAWKGEIVYQGVPVQDSRK